ncbi:MAG: TIGR03857 family LLM class F420-dependent oxidoreductase [Acidimicrobiales bacterium]
MANPARFVELGCYGLAGHVTDPRMLLDEVRDAERIGLGSVFLSERFNVKEAATLCGAAAAVSDEVGIATGVTNTPTRHPLVTAAWANTMHELTRGRFALGIGRGIAPLLGIMGIPPITMAQMEDAVGICRRLWNGEAVAGHDGPAGSYPLLSLGSDVHADIPVMAACLGFKTMRWAGRLVDGVILHTFVSDEALARCVAEVRAGAEEAGRDPSRVRVWAVLATLHEPDDERLLRGVTGRMATYLQVYGDALVAMNDWDPAPLSAFRDDPVVQSVPGAIDAVATIDQLEHIRGLIPEEWLPAAVGPAGVCARRVVDQLDAGADGVILHGSAPAELEPVVRAYAQIRPEGTFDGREANPGR